VRVTESARDHGLAVEAGQGFGIRRQFPRHHSDRHAFAEPKLSRCVHGAHSTFADKALDSVRAIDENGPNCNASPRLLSRGRKQRGHTDEPAARAVSPSCCASAVAS
jgi:hypothetical protein